MSKDKYLEVCATSDPKMTLKGWQLTINELIDKYGEDTVMFTDGGHNNVEMILLVERKDQ